MRGTATTNAQQLLSSGLYEFIGGPELVFYLEKGTREGSDAHTAVSGGASPEAWVTHISIVVGLRRHAHRRASSRLPAFFSLKVGVWGGEPVPPRGRGGQSSLRLQPESGTLISRILGCGPGGGEGAMPETGRGRRSRQGRGCIHPRPLRAAHSPPARRWLDGLKHRPEGAERSNAWQGSAGSKLRSPVSSRQGGACCPGAGKTGKTKTAPPTSAGQDLRRA